MNDLSKVSVIIPSLDPDSRLSAVVAGLIEIGFSDIIIVDDGSAEDKKANFPSSEKVTLLKHEVNKGKGAALKTALRFILKNRPFSEGAVTCDGDGQHLPTDVKRVAEQMLKSGKYVLGARDFSLDGVPKKSMVGNRLSAAALSLVCGLKISDTQTGLRAIPKSLFEQMSKVSGERFEYETNVLLELKSMGAEYEEITIETVYLDENKGSHFRPFADTVRICSLIIKYLGSSLSAFLTDILAFTLFNSALKIGVIPSTVIARAFSSMLNFALNKKLVFKSNCSLAVSALKYYLLAIPVMLVSAFGVKGLAYVFNLKQDAGAVTFLKIALDIIIFTVNFRIQQKWIFKSRNSK